MEQPHQVIEAVEVEEWVQLELLEIPVEMVELVRLILFMMVQLFIMQVVVAVDGERELQELVVQVLVAMRFWLGDL